MGQRYIVRWRYFGPTERRWVYHGGPIDAPWAGTSICDMVGHRRTPLTLQEAKQLIRWWGLSGPYPDLALLHWPPHDIFSDDDE